MTVTIQTPDYLPGLDYFERISMSGVCIFLDNAKLGRKDNVARTRILGQDQTERLIVPLRRNRNGGRHIRDETIDNSEHWKKKHLKKLHHVYNRAPYFEESYPQIQALLNREWSSIAEMNSALITALCSSLQISAAFYHASEFYESIQKADQMIDLIAAVSGSVLLAEERDRPFLTEACFREGRIGLEFHDYRHTPYPQYDREFVPGLSIVDALFFCGRQKVHSMLIQRTSEC